MKIPRSSSVTFIIAFVATAFAVTPAQATLINVPNASFENPTTPTGGDGAPIPGWLFNSPSGNLYGTSLIANSFISEGAASGKNYAFMFNDVAGKTDIITSSASLAIIQPNMDYTLSVAVGNVAGSDSVSNHSPGNVSFSLLANGVAFATDTVPNGTVPDGTFEDFSLTFQTPGSGSLIGENLTIQLASLPTSGPGSGPAFDNVVLNATSIAVAPEPSTWALLITSCLVLGWLIRRQTIAQRIGLAAVALTIAAVPLRATPVNIPNASFDSPGTPTSTSTNDNVLPGWVFNAKGGNSFGSEAIYKYFYDTAGSSGANFLFLDNLDTTTKETVTSAAPITTIAPLTTYTLTVAVGNVKGADTTIYAAPGNVTFSLLADGVSIATEEVRNGIVSNGTWEEFSLSYTSPVSGSVIGEDLTIQLASLPQTAWGYQAAFDNVTLDAEGPDDSGASTVPEPQTVALFLSGLFFLLWRTQWRRVLKVA